MLEEINDKFTTKDKKVITRDWEGTLKYLKRYKDLDVINRIGPLVIGVYLKMGRLNTFYTPIYYVHNLCREFPCFTSTLNIRGKMISPEKHNQMYQAEAEILLKNAYVAIEGNQSINEIISGYERYFKATNLTSYKEYEDLALICGWSANAHKIEYALKLIYDKWKVFPEERFFGEEGGFDNWFKSLEEKVWNSNKLSEIVENEIIKHKLANIPERKIIS